MRCRSWSWGPKGRACSLRDGRLPLQSQLSLSLSFPLSLSLSLSLSVYYNNSNSVDSSILVRGQLKRVNYFPCPRSPLRISSRETGRAIPSRVTLLILVHFFHDAGSDICCILVCSSPSFRFPPRRRPSTPSNVILLF